MKKPSPSMVVSLSALVIALGGTAISQPLITGSNIKDGSIKARDLDRSLRAELGRTGAQGPAGPAGQAGPSGPAGGFDVSKLMTYVGPSVYVPSGASEFNINADCPAGSRPTGGGYFSNIARATRSAPTTTGWNVFLYNDSYVAVEARAYVVCASA